MVKMVTMVTDRYHWSVELMRGGVEDRLTPFIWDSVDDANLYINNTVEEIRQDSYCDLGPYGSSKI